MRKIKYIVIHCTATSQDAKKTSIMRYWADKLKWRMPGYHYLIRKDGYLHKLAREEEVTNGVKGFNKNSIHVAYIGGIDGEGKAVDNRTPEQKKELRRLVTQLSKVYPDAEIKGHRDFSIDKNKNGIIDPHERIKECPSFDVQDLIDYVKAQKLKDVSKSEIEETNISITENINFKYVESKYELDKKHNSLDC